MPYLILKLKPSLINIFLLSIAKISMQFISISKISIILSIINNKMKKKSIERKIFQCNKYSTKKYRNKNNLEQIMLRLSSTECITTVIKKSLFKIRDKDSPMLPKSHQEKILTIRYTKTITNLLIYFYLSFYLIN